MGCQGKSTLPSESQSPGSMVTIGVGPAEYFRQERDSFKKKGNKEEFRTRQRADRFLLALGHPRVKGPCAVSGPDSVELVVPVGGKQGGKRTGSG